MLVILCCLCYRRRRKPSTVSVVTSNDSEPETARLPRGGEKTYDDVLATRYRRASLDSEEGGVGRRSAAGSRSQRSRRSPDRAHNRDRDDDYYGYARSARDDRSDWRDSYDYDYERRARTPTPAARAAGPSTRKGDAYQPSSSSLSSRRDSAYSGRSEPPPLPSYPDRLAVSRTGGSDRDREYGQRSRTPRSANPFSSEYDSEPPSSPRRYLYPEVVTGSEKKEDKGKKKDDEVLEEPQPMNFLPVFSTPKFTQLPGTNAIVELI